MLAGATSEKHDPTRRRNCARVILLMEWPAVLQQRMLAGGTEDEEHAMSQKLLNNFVVRDRNVAVRTERG